MRFVFFLAFFLLSLGAEGDKRVVFDLTSGDLKRFKRSILSGIIYHKTHYEGRLERLDVAVVIHGDAYKFFVKDLKNSPYAKESAVLKEQKELEKRLASLASFYEVSFLVCQSGIKKRKIEQENLYPFVTLVPNAAIGLIDKQSEGYAYIPLK